MKLHIRLLVWICLLALVVTPSLAQEESSAPTLRIGILPEIGVYPFFVEPSEGDKVAGVSIEVLLLPSAVALREALAAGEIDGFQADLFSALLLWEEGYEVRVVRSVGLIEPAFLGLVTLGDSGRASVGDLRGARIGISKSTLIQYQTDQMLASAGIRPDEVELWISSASNSATSGS